MPTAMMLEDYLNGLPKNTNVALDDEHVLCVDNVFLRFLYGMKMAKSDEQKQQIATLHKRSTMDECWERSSENVFKFMDQIFGSKDHHRTTGMTGLFKAKKLVQAMKEPLATGISALEVKQIL